MVRAVEWRTGRVRWATTSDPPATDYYFHGNPLITPDSVIIGADIGRVKNGTAGVHAFDRASGRQRWTHPVGPGAAAGIVGLGRWAYATTLEGRLLALDAGTGVLQWSFPARLWGWEGPAAESGRVFVGTRTGTLYALSAETGKVEWQTALGAQISTSVTVITGGLYLGTVDGLMHRIDKLTGTLLGSRRIDTELRPRGVPVVAGQTLLVLLADRTGQPSTLVALDAMLTRERWRQRSTAPWSTARVFVTGHAALVGTEKGEVVSFCLEDGRTSSTRGFGTAVRSIGGTGDLLFVGTTGGILSAVTARTGCTVD